MSSKKPAEPMPISERAKQFLPFAALTGLDEALRAKELEVEQTTTVHYVHDETASDSDASHTDCQP